jgi:pSer/pThr/pTyr-binding forkhead associated (FHA) protein
MLQLKILSGKKAGASWAARRLPVRIGRAAAADLQFEDPGVWEDHVQIRLEARNGFVLATQGEALASINGEPVREQLLRNGDTIQLGSVNLQFWLAETRQPGLGFREALMWCGIGAVCLGQIALIYLLLR